MFLSRPKALIVAAIKVFFFQESSLSHGLEANPSCLANSDYSPLTLVVCLLFQLKTGGSKRRFGTARKLPSRQLRSKRRSAKISALRLKRNPAVRKFAKQGARKL